KAKDGEEARQVFFGPLDDADRGDDAFSPLYKQSLYCASCHEGVVFGVPVYTTYSEWLASLAKKAGQQCQDCHMKPTGAMTNFAPEPFAGKGGKLYAKLLKSEDGHRPAPFWNADPTPVDNRLSPNQEDETTFVFPADVVRLRVRVVYRRFWPETAARKKWPDA